jgi:hypothetical protein
MMQEIVQTVADSLVEVLVLSLLSFGSFALAKGRTYLKTKTTDKQYDMLVKISKDVYEYVEREFGEKLGEYGEEKLTRGFQVFDAQMKKHNLPYSAQDFKLQVEKIIKQEKAKQ